MQKLTILSERQRQLLNAIVELYVKNGEPVSSEVVEKTYDLGVSPATIRNEMVRLTDLGYLRQLHTSAGRTPTSIGFRYYISELMKEKDMPIMDEVVIRQQMMDQKLRFDRVIKEATRALSSKCNTLAMAVSSDGEVYYTGAASILDFPEFDDIDVARFVLSLFDNLALLAQITGMARGSDPLHVIFGEETQYRYLYPTSFAFLDYQVESGQKGIIGIIGPARLNFPMVIPYLKYVGKMLTEAGKVT